MSAIKKMKMFVVATLSMGVIACGGGSTEGGTTSPSTSKVLVSGRAIDGYIVGATVYYDFNGNGLMDADEPSSITIAGGKFAIAGELTEAQTECVEYTQIMVDVPVGAVDETEGVVEEAYQLSFPPAKVIAWSRWKDGVNITPITTVIWDSAKAEFEERLGMAYNCAAVKDDELLVLSTARQISNMVSRLVSKYKLTEDELYSDFIATGNAEMYGIGQRLMESIRLTFARNGELLKQYPDGSHSAFYYFENETWFLSEGGDTTDGGIYTLSEVNENWEAVVVHYHSEDTITTLDDGSVVKSSFSYLKESNTCTNREEFTFNTESNVIKLSFTHSVRTTESFDDCIMETPNADTGTMGVTVTETIDETTTKSLSFSMGEWDDEERSMVSSIPAVYAKWTGFSSNDEFDFEEVKQTLSADFVGHTLDEQTFNILPVKTITLSTDVWLTDADIRHTRTAYYLSDNRSWRDTDNFVISQFKSIIYSNGTSAQYKWNEETQDWVKR